MISSAYLFPRTDNPIGPVLPLNFGMLIWGLDDKPPIQVNSITFFLNSDKSSSDCPLMGAENGVVGKIKMDSTGKFWSSSEMNFFLRFTVVPLFI